MKELHDLLNRATDRVESPNLTVRALAVARRRRATYRSALAASVVAAVLVLGVALLVQLNRGGSDGVPPVTTTATTKAMKAAEIAQPAWDPRTVDDLPTAGVVTALPGVIDPPATATPLAGDPVDAAVLTIEGPDAVLLLARDGSWRSVPLGVEFGGAELSADGSRLAVATDTGADIWDLPTGERTMLANPDGSIRLDLPPTWVWLNDSTLLFDDARAGGWLVHATSGEATRVPYPSNSLTDTVDAQGAVVESANNGRAAQLIDWAGGKPRRVDMTGIGRLSSIRADAGTVVGTSDVSFGTGVCVVVAERADLDPRYVLPIANSGDNYGGGKLSVVALLDDDTVLLQFPVYGDTPSWRLVAWDPRSGELTRVTRGDLPVPASYASDLLR